MLVFTAQGCRGQISSLMSQETQYVHNLGQDIQILTYKLGL